MAGFLFLGFLIGMQHALEADHLAAVGAMAARRGGSRRSLVLRGAVWGLGHTITLFAICSAVILLGLTLTDRVAATMEFAVGVMLVVLGLDVLRRLWKERIHFHVHRHDDRKPHVHAHSHAGETVGHAASDHRHRHREGLPLRALAVGLVHGAAGSAGLLALAVAATGEPAVALAYVALFGVGSILGMALLSLVASWPLIAVERHAKLAHRAIGLGAGGLAIVLGLFVMTETAGAMLAL